MIDPPRGWGVEGFAIAWLTADEARELPNQMLKAAGSTQSF
jgi:hypothetical protein